MSKILITKNKIGYFELKNKPDQKFLERYYSGKYYKENHGNYRKKYSKDEVTYFQSRIERVESVLKELNYTSTKTLLDIGCGEGYLLSYFFNKKWNILGLDYNKDACVRKNPKIAEFIRSGDVFESIRQLINTKMTFDVINMTNTLEHLLDPVKILKLVKKISHRDTILVITVPNDFSILQKFLLKEKLVDSRFWISYPDHITYFDKKSLENICFHCGWIDKFIMSDFPIDVFLSNPRSNYISNQLNGKMAHQSRVKLENLLNSISIKDTVEFYRAAAKLGLGRQLTIFCKQNL